LTTPGVPGELRAMLPEVCERIVAAIGGGESHRVRLQTFGIGESTAQARIDEDSEHWPEDVVLGFRAGMPQLEIKLTAATIDRRSHHWRGRRHAGGRLARSTARAR